MVGLLGALLGIAIIAAVTRLLAPRRDLRIALFDRSPMPMFVIDLQTLRFLDVNSAALEHYGYSREEFLSMNLTQLHAPDEVATVLREVRHGDETYSPGVVRHRTKDGKAVYASIRRFDFRYRGVAARLVHALDVTPQQETEQRLRENEATLQLAQEVAQLGNFAYDYRTQKAYLSPELCRILGISSSEVRDGALWDYDHPDDAARVRLELESARAEKRRYKSDHRIVRSDGTVRHVEERGYWIYDEDGEPVRMFGTLLDITERKASETALAHLAFHDPLTNLLNRAGLRDYLARTLVEARAGALTPVFFFDLDRFKTINDTLGHVAGDHVIAEIGRRLERQLRPGEVLARTGGDEFMVVSPPVADRTKVSLRARELMDAFREAFTTTGIEHNVSASLGISIFPLDAQEPDALLRSADVAMYAAKGRGGNTFHYYTSELQRSAEERFRLESAMRRALERNEFALHYQPVVCGRSGRVLAVEALLRWTDPQRGTIAPSDFIPLAEETGFIRHLGAWAFEQAVAQAKRWSDVETPVRVWVNVSPTQLRDAGLPQLLADLLRQHNLDGSLLGLELTESSFINHERDVLATLNRVRALNIGLALDDFGVKYSSLEYLQRLPIDVIKIDRVFVTDVATNAFNASIVRAIVGIAHDVGFKVTAEGIESASELAILNALGCDAWQGFLFSHARPPQQIDEILTERLHFTLSS